ncbi:hypothetical protein RN616_11670 [Morganella morganii]|uniref:hypothetical protein n=1 Tax=Morganella morganii TaxID=582 RepID=UPI0028D5600E|nr:hypothetical protein [Morganella morganii]EKU5843327.1 hypothetical protein [Morganella morganii]WNP29192.1 hypothetical protein RN616_11670 [Morganella morganii]
MIGEKNTGSEVIEVIKKYVVIEWRNVDIRFIKRSINPLDILCADTYVYDGINILPSTNFRINSDFEPIGFMKILGDSVNSFTGKLPWTLFGFKKRNNQYNWTISPLIATEKKFKDYANLEGIPLKLYFEKYHPEYGQLAFADIPLLAKHIDKCLAKYFEPIDYNKIY